MQRPTGDDGYRSTYVPQLLSSKVLDKASDQGAFTHFGGPDYYDHNRRGFQGSPVYEGDMMFFHLYVLGPTRKEGPWKKHLSCTEIDNITSYSYF